MTRLYLLCVLPAASLICGCAAWNSTRDTSTFVTTKTFDGTTVWPIDLVVLGGEVNSQLQGPLAALEEHTDNVEEQDRLLLAGDCGVVALYANDLGVARKYLDMVIATYSTTAIRGASEERAKSLTGAESVKRFRGEPHERALMYFYRGMLYLNDGDPENARACFKIATLMGAMAEKSADRCNWQSADLMTLLMDRLLDDSATADDRAVFIASKYERKTAEFDLGHKPQRLVIVVAAVGLRPDKYTRNARLCYAPRESVVDKVIVRLGDREPADVPECDDVFVQAVTRGTRNMDMILQAKAEAQQSREDSGGVLIGLGAAAGGLVGLAVKMIGGAIYEAGQKVNTQADTRQFQTLPRKLFLWYSDDIPLDNTLTVEMSDKSGKQIACSSVPVPSRRGPVIILARFGY